MKLITEMAQNYCVQPVEAPQLNYNSHSQAWPVMNESVPMNSHSFATSMPMYSQAQDLVQQKQVLQSLEQFQQSKGAAGDQIYLTNVAQAEKMSNVMNPNSSWSTSQQYSSNQNYENSIDNSSEQREPTNAHGEENSNVSMLPAGAYYGNFLNVRCTLLRSLF